MPCGVQFSLVNKVKWFQLLPRITNNSIKHQSFIYTHLDVKSLPLETIQFSMSTQFKCQKSSIWPIDRTLSGATTPDKSEPGSGGNEEVFRIPQCSSIPGAPPSDCLVLYPWHPLEGVLLLCKNAAGVFYRPTRLDQEWLVLNCNSRKHSTVWKQWITIPETV